MNLIKIKNYLLLILLIILPWQTRWIYSVTNINGGFWEYGSYSLYGSEILLCFILFLILIDRLTKRTDGNKFFSCDFFMTRRRNFLLAMLFLAVLAVILFNSLDTSLAYYWLTFYIFSICLFFVILISKLDYFKIGAAVWFSGFFPAILAIVQFLTQNVFACKWLGLAAQSGVTLGSSVVEYSAGRFLRAYGSLSHPNALGIYLGAVLLLGFILYVYCQNARFKIVLSVGQMILSAALVFTFSRGALLSLMVGWILLLIMVLSSKKSLFKDFLRLSIFHALLMIILFVLCASILGARINLQNRLEYVSVTERAYQINIWQSIFNRRPLLGVGPGNYTLAFYLIEPKLNFWQYQPVHNALLLLLSEFGLLFFVPVFMLFLFYLKIILRHNNLNAVLLIFLFFSTLFDHWLFSSYVGIMLIAVVAALVVLDTPTNIAVK